MSLKTLIFFGLLAVAFGFTLPEESSPVSGTELVYGDDVPLQDDYELVLVRKARSPQGYLSATYEKSNLMGKSATIDYNHQLRRNFEVYGGASRNFRFNDNSGHVGLRYRF